jgi:hypothetical protein
MEQVTDCAVAVLATLNHRRREIDELEHALQRHHRIGVSQRSFDRVAQG